MGKRRQVARGADRALPRNHRQNVPVEERRPASRSPARLMPEAPCESALILSSRIRRTTAGSSGAPDARRMRAHDIELQGGQIGGGDALLGELAEAGIDAIDRIAGCLSSRATVSRAARRWPRAPSAESSTRDRSGERCADVSRVSGWSPMRDGHDAPYRCEPLHRGAEGFERSPSSLDVAAILRPHACRRRRHPTRKHCRRRKSSCRAPASPVAPDEGGMSASSTAISARWPGASAPTGCAIAAAPPLSAAS